MCIRDRPYALGSDLMMHEAFCLYAQADIFDPYKKNHSTVKDACELAEGLGIPNLLLYHTEDRNKMCIRDSIRISASLLISRISPSRMKRR